MIPLTTSKKIWLSVGILLAGYSLSMLFGIVLGQKNLRQVQQVTHNWYPATEQSRQAVTFFDGQIVLYSDAVSLQDPEMLVLANVEAQNVYNALQAIETLQHFAEPEMMIIQELQRDLSEFSSKASVTYEQAIQMMSNIEAGQIDSQLQQRLFEVAQKSEEFRDRLQLLAKRFSELLHDELQHVGQDLKREQYLNAAVFLIVTVLSLSFVWTILQHSEKDILERDRALNQVLLGEVELGEAFIELNSVSSKIVEEAELTTQQVTIASLDAKKMDENIRNIASAVQHLSENIRKMSGNTTWVFKVLPQFTHSVRQANILVNDIGLELREIRNIGLILEELGTKPDKEKWGSQTELQQFTTRIADFSRAIVQKVGHLQTLFQETVETSSTVDRQCERLGELVEVTKSTFDSQVLETHHISLIVDELQHGNASIGRVFTSITDRAEHFSSEAQRIQNEAQKILEQVRQFHKLVQTANAKQQTLRDHHISSSPQSSEIQIE